MKRCLLLLLLLPMFLFAEKNILVLHSYHHGLEWTDDISQGLIDTFEDSDEKINLYFEYLDAKRNVSSSFLETTYDYFKVKHQQTNFDLIIASDNKALVFLNQYLHKLFPNTPVVFCGINDYDSTLTNNLKFFTGVKESVAHEKTIELASKLFPKRKYLMVILDETLTAKKLFREVKRIEAAFDSRFAFVYYSHLRDEEIEKFLATHKDEMIVYLLTYNRDKNGKFYSYKESIKHLKERFDKNIPFVGSWSFFLGKGIVGGAITSGSMQGKIAGQLARRVLKGEDIQKMPVLSSLKAIKTMGDFPELEHFNLNRGMFPKGSKFINLPQPSWIKYKYEITVGGTFLVITLLLLGGVVFLKVEENALLEEMNRELDNKIQQATKQIKKEETLFRFIADTSQNVIFLIGTDTRLTYANTSFDTYFNTDHTDLLYTQMDLWLPSDLHEIISMALENLEKDDQMESSFEYFNAEQECMSRIYVFAHYSEENQLIGYKIVINDITEEGRQIAKLIKKSHNDALTGIYNRAYFDETSTQMFTRNASLSLLIIDIDYFKKINDTFGHAIGDEILKNVASLLQQNVRKQDKVFRIGGEEFAVILPLTHTEAMHLSEKLRSNIEQTTFDVEEHSIRLTISIGVSTKDETHPSFKALFETADKALYKAKTQGRNQICS